MRRARLSDGPAWRRARLLNESRLRPAMSDGHDGWDRQSSLTAWADHLREQRAATRTGAMVPYLLATTDDEVLGECTFSFDERSGLAELSLWSIGAASHALARWATATGILQLFEDPDPVPWVVGPVAVTNRGPAGLLAVAGFESVGVARQLRVYDGAPTDHEMWRMENSAATRAHLRMLAETVS